MSETQPAFDGFATELFFIDAGGLSAWKQADRLRTPNEVEEIAVDEISLALLAIANYERTIFDFEQEQAFSAGKEGLEFGLHVLAHNLIDVNKLMTDHDFELMLKHYACVSADVIERIEEGLEPDPEAEDGSIDGFRSFIEENIYELCPEVEWHAEFLQGATLAEFMFKSMLNNKQNSQKRELDEEFSKIIENFDL